MLSWDNMSERLEQAAQEALRAAMVRLQDLAKEARLHQVTLSRWHTGATGISPERALRMATTLKARALRLLDLATELEVVARTEMKGGSDDG